MFWYVTAIREEGRHRNMPESNSGIEIIIIIIIIIINLLAPEFGI
jgi:hypothetical protein